MADRCDPLSGRQKYIHVSIDMFSRAAFTSAHAGEKTKDVTRHFLLVFATLGVPEQIKTANSPAYTSHKLRDFFNQWGVKHSTAQAYHTPLQDSQLLKGPTAPLSGFSISSEEGQRPVLLLRGSVKPFS